MTALITVLDKTIRNQPTAQRHLVRHKRGKKKGSQRSIIRSAISASQCFSSILKTPLTGVNRSELNPTSCDRPTVPPVLTTVVDHFPVRALYVQVGEKGGFRRASLGSICSPEWTQRSFRALLNLQWPRCLAISSSLRRRKRAALL